MGYKVITIGRQFGSGGHEIAEALSKKLQIPLYDKNLIEMAGDMLDMDEKSLKAIDESVLNKFLASYRIPDGSHASGGQGLTLTDSMFLAQSRIIESLAKKGPCIIVGRCADYVLRNFPGCVNVFICANTGDRLRRVMMRHFLTEKEAKEKIKRMDRRRKNYYETYTNRKWGSIKSHQALLNVSLLGKEQTISIIGHMYHKEIKEDLDE